MTKRNGMNFYASAAAALILWGCASVPYTGRKQMVLVSEADEIKMGQEAYAKVLKESKLSTDAGKTAMVRRVGERLAKIANAPADYQWEFNLIEDEKQINAFCLPGGKVAVYTALLPVAKDEAGLAVVMGHEISHALARHGAERMSQGMAANIGGEILSVALAGQAPGTQDAFSKAYGLGMNVGVMLPFSRSHESEADHIGLILMAKAGYDPHAALDFWKRMKTATKAPDSSLAKYLSTHPGDETRITAIEGWMPEAMKYYKNSGE